MCHIKLLIQLLRSIFIMLPSKCSVHPICHIRKYNSKEVVNTTLTFSPVKCPLIKLNKLKKSISISCRQSIIREILRHIPWIGYRIRTYQIHSVSVIKNICVFHVYFTFSHKFVSNFFCLLRAYQIRIHSLVLIDFKSSKTLASKKDNNIY